LPFEHLSTVIISPKNYSIRSPKEHHLQYYVEASDSISIVMNFDSEKRTYGINRISGRGTAKYLAALSLSNSSYLIVDEYSYDMVDRMRMITFDRIAKQNGLVLSVRKQILESYKERIDP